MKLTIIQTNDRLFPNIPIIQLTKNQICHRTWWSFQIHLIQNNHYLPHRSPYQHLTDHEFDEGVQVLKKTPRCEIEPELKTNKETMSCTTAAKLFNKNERNLVMKDLSLILQLLLKLRRNRQTRQVNQRQRRKSLISRNTFHSATQGPQDTLVDHVIVKHLFQWMWPKAWILTARAIISLITHQWRDLLGSAEIILAITGGKLSIPITHTYQGTNESNRLHEEIKDFCRFMSPTPAERAMRKDVIARLTEIVKGVWPEAEIYVFGSIATELYLPSRQVLWPIFVVNVPL